MQDLLTTHFLGRSITYLDELDSTNSYCKHHATNLPHGAVVMAGQQTAGRGRLGRAWVSRPNTGIYCSVLLHNQSIENLRTLPLVTGIAVCKALEQLYGSGFSIKWSNDVLLHNKKVCGILCESQILGQQTFAVLGIGINGAQTQADFDHHDLVYATSLQLATGKTIPFRTIVAEILNNLEEILLTYQENGFSSLRQDYKQHCVTLGREVRILSGKQEKRGVAIDIAEDGSLLCNIDGKLQAVCAGDVSVRGLYGYI